MERLTKKEQLAGHMVNYVNAEDCFDVWSTPKKFMGNAIDRLAAYEDTGLAPEEILTGKELAEIAIGLQQFNRIRSVFSDERIKELMQAEKEGRLVVLNVPRKPLVWGDDEQNTCLCPDCGKDLMGIPYGERRILQCPECGQYLDDTKIVTHKEAQAALKEREERP